MKITSSESKRKLKRSGMRLITSLDFNYKARSHKYKKARYAIGNFSEKDFSKIIRELEKFEKLPYEKKRPKHETVYSYYFPARQLAKCMMRSDTLNWHDYGGYTEMTPPSTNIYTTDEGESKRIIVQKTLSQSCSTNEGVEKCSIINKTLLRNYYVCVEKLCSTKI